MARNSSRRLQWSIHQDRRHPQCGHHTEDAIQCGSWRRVRESQTTPGDGVDYATLFVWTNRGRRKGGIGKHNCCCQGRDNEEEEERTLYGHSGKMINPPLQRNDNLCSRRDLWCEYKMSMTALSSSSLMSFLLSFLSLISLFLS